MKTTHLEPNCRGKDPELIKVLLVDDSPIIRKRLKVELAACTDIRVIGEAGDGYEATERLISLQPDAIILDIEMPRMDGLTFLTDLMLRQPLPVVIFSSVAQKNSANAVRALSLGAVNVVPKPGPNMPFKDVAKILVTSIRGAARARVGRTPPPSVEPEPRPDLGRLADTDAVIAVGASTGGIQAVERVLREIPRDAPGIVIVQHLPAPFMESLAHRLDAVSAMRVKVATEGDPVTRGTALLSPGDRHLVLEGSAGSYRARITDGDLVHYQRPSVDVLFRSVARTAGPRGVGLLLTGMGRDGAEGLLEMRNQGAHTIAESAESCVVYGMPRSAVEIDAACEVAHLEDAVGCVVRALAGRVGVPARGPAGDAGGTDDGTS